jgi:hypothetical protein
MPTLDVFNSDAFSCRSLTAAIESVPYQPQMLGNLGIFDAMPVRTDLIEVESRDGVLTLIQTDQRGAPPVNRTTEKRKVRGFKTVRLAKQDKLFASELQGIRAFGSESELMQVQAEIMRRYAGPTGILRDLELTWENHRLGAVQGVVLDADGSTITNWFTEFGVTQDAEIDFDLDNAAPASGAVRKLCNTVVRQMQRAAKGAWTSSTRIMGICGDAFWDDLTAHSEVRQTYLNTQQAAALREGIAWETFNYGGITWTNYRGTDDGSTIAVGTDKAKFFPVGAPGVFQVAMSPGESFDVVNTPGRPVYGMIVPDRDRNMFASIEAYSYPLYICTRPLMLQRGKRT